VFNQGNIFENNVAAVRDATFFEGGRSAGGHDDDR